MTAPATTTSPAVPAWLVGGWTRESISIGQDAPTETATVWWLQTPSFFADLRVPFDAATPALSFAGTVRWQDPLVTWIHDLDLTGWSAVDTGRVHLEGDRLIEQGTWSQDGDKPQPYVETWRRLPGAKAPIVSLRRDAPHPARFVRVGDHALVVADLRPHGRYIAVGWRGVAGPWTRLLSWPPEGPDDLWDDVIALAPSPGDSSALATGDALDLADAGTWMVEEVLM